MDGWVWLNGLAWVELGTHDAVEWAKGAPMVVKCDGKNRFGYNARGSRRGD